MHKFKLKQIWLSGSTMKTKNWRTRWRCVLCLVQFVFTLGHWADWKFMKWSAWLNCSTWYKITKNIDLPVSVNLWMLSVGFVKSGCWSDRPIQHLPLCFSPMRVNRTIGLGGHLDRSCCSIEWPLVMMITSMRVNRTIELGGQFRLLYWSSLEDNDDDDDDNHDGEQDHSIVRTVHAAPLNLPNASKQAARFLNGPDPPQ